MAAIRVIINGAKGRMGQEASKAVQAEEGLELVAMADFGDNLVQLIADKNAQVVVDFTTASVVYETAKTIIGAGVHPVIGTSGLLPEQVEELQKLSNAKSLGGLIAPNFAIGAVLMMKFAKDAVRYFPDVEIIELHHDRKADAPSGTAVKTMNMLAEAREKAPNPRTEKEILAGARGASDRGIHVHSVRLPGLVAHQEVIFGGLSETLTIRHDSIHRESFMPGVCLSCRKVMDLNELIYGLEHVL
ncbi:MAG: 4-hydroxy-tetrahydrodipicolinate reductase [SAR324 cluster bacterium]|nr:4-hydroxy-tetrahydrodipicolinate reductase [SAR324 cluster bacterium]